MISNELKEKINNLFEELDINQKTKQNLEIEYKLLND